MKSFYAHTLTRRSFGKISLAAAMTPLAFALNGCVNQHPQNGKAGTTDTRLIATSPAVASMCDRLNLDLIAVPKTSFELPKRYQDLPIIGPPMSPDMEALSKLRPCLAISPRTLIDDLRPKYKAAGIASIFVNLGSVEGLYDSADYLGKRFAKEQEAHALRDDFNQKIETFRRSISKSEAPNVLILMGVPGSYIVATEKSYVGNLAKLAGGKNIYPGEEKPFIAANTEDMLKRDPDVILRTAHALPDQVMEMFAKEFETNDIWKHFRAVKKDRVFDLPYDLFGMSATLEWPSALEYLREPFYGTGGEL